MGDKISVAQGPTYEADAARDDGFHKGDGRPEVEVDEREGVAEGGPFAEHDLNPQSVQGDETREHETREVNASGTANVKPTDPAGDPTGETAHDGLGHVSDESDTAGEDDYDTRDKASLSAELSDRGHTPPSRATRDEMIAQLRHLDEQG